MPKARVNTNGVDEMLDMLYEMIDDAKAIAFSSDCRLDRNGALDLLDSIRNRFPVELSEAVKVVQSRDQLIAEARQNADRIVKQAEEQARRTTAEAEAQAKRMVDDSEVIRQARAAAEEAVRAARNRAGEILTKANEEARNVTAEAEERAENLKRSANEYCADALRRTEDAVAEAYGGIRDSHEHFQALISSSTTGGARRNTAYDAEKDE